MEKNTKIMMNNGIAFSEKKQLATFQKMASEGWMIDSMSMFSFTFKKAEPQELIFSFDYLTNHADFYKTLSSLKKVPQAYIELFAETGWTYHCGYSGIAVFSADPGTTPLHTDAEIENELRQQNNKELAKWMIIFFLAFLVFIFLIVPLLVRFVPHFALFTIITMIGFILTLGFSIMFAMVLFSNLFFKKK